MEDIYKLRPWIMEDLEQLVIYANNKKIADKLTDMFPHPYSKDDGIKFIEMTMQSEPRQILAIDLNGIAIGAIGLHPQKDIQRMNAELGYWLAEPFWGKGIISWAIKEMVEYGFNNLSINRIFARPFGSNKASQRVLEKAGFVLEARFKNTYIKNGVYLDELIYAIRR